MLSEEKLNELCAKELLELDRHTYGYATAGKDINAVLDRYVIAYKSGYRAAERGAQELFMVIEKTDKLLEEYGCPTNGAERQFTQEQISKWRERGV